MLLMLEELARRDIRPAECQAKVFGGANMFPGHKRNDLPGVGRKNGTAARKLLGSHGIEIVSEHLFGIGHRQIVFNVGTGDVWARQMTSLAGQDAQ
jgi:chemotaxis protein CheD